MIQFKGQNIVHWKITIIIRLLNNVRLVELNILGGKSSMGGFFGVTSREDCVMDLFFGTDYHSHIRKNQAELKSRR